MAYHVQRANVTGIFTLHIITKAGRKTDLYSLNTQPGMQDFIASPIRAKPGKPGDAEPRGRNYMFFSISLAAEEKVLTI